MDQTLFTPISLHKSRSRNLCQRLLGEQILKYCVVLLVHEMVNDLYPSDVICR